jgi:hypothetical protein
MKRLTRLAVVVLLGFALTGCGAAAKTIAMKSQSERTDVFKEVSDVEAIPMDYADVIIRANIKTHLEGYYVAESKASAHGKPTYPFVINIDGQAAVWNVEGKMETVAAYTQEGKTSHDPEAGEGMKYVLEKKVRLTAGAHEVFFGLPGESYSATTSITVKDGGVYVLEFKPLYKYKTRPTRIPTFLKGIRTYEIMVSENTLR